MYGKEREHDLVQPRTDCNDVSPFPWSGLQIQQRYMKGAAVAQVLPVPVRIYVAGFGKRFSRLLFMFL